MTNAPERPPLSESDVPTEDLPAILADLWDRLADGAARSKSAFHLPTLCTAADREPAARTVVLRFADRDEAGGTIACHTDVRGPKVAEIRENPRVAWVFYDAAARLQVRLSGTARVLTDGPVVDAAWEATQPSARRCYLAPLPPGTATDGPAPHLPAAVQKRDPTPAESAPGRANFAVLRTVADRLDWLHLHHAGHLRAQFVRDGDEWNGTWVAV